MKKKFRRWYEKHESLKTFMEMLRNLPTNVQCEIAVDIIIEASSLIDREYDKMIQEVATYNPRDYNRWYDINPNLHLAIESLKDLNDEQKTYIVNMFMKRVAQKEYGAIREIKRRDIQRHVRAHRFEGFTE